MDSISLSHGSEDEYITASIGLCEILVEPRRTERFVVNAFDTFIATRHG
jgi:hypothetical protein